MSFDNFFKESDERDFRLKLIAFGGSILIIIVFFGWIISPESDRTDTVEQSTQVTTSPVKSAEQLREDQPPPVKYIDHLRRKRVEELCASLPRPEKFHFLNKENIVESYELTLIRYTFKSARSWDEVMPAFVVWLNANGWKSLPNNTSTFTKENQTIAFSTVSNDTANYEIFCSEKTAESEAISFGIYDISY